MLLRRSVEPHYLANKVGYWPDWLFHNLLETGLTYPTRRYGLI